MHIALDSERCVGCGLCEEHAPSIFEMGRYVAKLKQDQIPDSLVNEVFAAIKECPSGALKIVHTNSVT